MDAVKILTMQPFELSSVGESNAQKVAAGTGEPHPGRNGTR
jgi:hypothetical protein